MESWLEVEALVARCKIEDKTRSVQVFCRSVEESLF